MMCARKLVQSYFGSCDLREAAFTGSDMRSAVFVDCDLSGVILERADCRSATFIRCKLDSSYLTGANFTHAVFQECTFDKALAGSTRFDAVEFMGDASFRGASMRDASFNGTCLNGVDFQGAYLKGVSFPLSDETGIFCVDDNTMKTFFCFLLSIQVEDMEEDTWGALKAIRVAAEKCSRASDYGVFEE